MISMAAPAFDEATFKAVESVIRSGMLAQGARVDEFEKAFASYIGVKHAVAVNSGTAALHTALVAAGIGPGDEVITTPFSFIASANSILFSGARPVFADIDPAQTIDSGIRPDSAVILSQFQVFICGVVVADVDIAAASGDALPGYFVWPLVYHKQLVGQLILAPRALGEPFKPAEWQMIEHISYHVSVAVHDILLEHELHRRQIEES